MHVITCGGLPYEIGIQRGRQAQDEVHGKKSSPDYVLEMRGNLNTPSTKDSVHLDLILIIIQKVSLKELVFVLKTFWPRTYAPNRFRHNWDWEREQSRNLSALRIDQSNGKPSIQMVTEGGIIGKIGFNEHSVAVNLNAIQAAGVSFKKLPCHLALRYLLESKSLEEGIDGVAKYGVASSCHILVADSKSSTGIEFSAFDHVLLPMGDPSVGHSEGVVTHTNHHLHNHKLQGNGRLDVNVYIPNSKFRLARIRQLIVFNTRKAKSPAIV
ncbi:hypothetical protein KEM56_005676 [Ascosphaera pollenicola]|nr:hypothetical protein KEM56_005676 [Ascosphaera pollenicola]